MTQNKKHLLIISSFARDKITYLKSGKTVEKLGGPAFWISETLKDLKIDFDILTGKKRAEVEIFIDDSQENGIIKSVDKIALKEKRKADLIIISTISNEFDLGLISDKLDGDVVLDMQGYVRHAKLLNNNFNFPTNLAKRIKIIKATEEESAHLKTELADIHSGIILLITKGKDGADIVENGKKYSFQAPEIKSASNTLGAGDVFLTAFTVSYMNNKNAYEAGKFATLYTSRFLKKKSA